MPLSNVKVSDNGNTAAPGKTKEVQSWTVVKEGKTFTVWDTNENGYLDAKDISKCISGNGSLNEYDIMEAGKQAAELEGGPGLTLQEQAQYSALEKKLKASQESTASTQKTTKKKSNWLGKTLGVLSVAGAGFLGYSMIKSMKDGNSFDNALALSTLIPTITNSMFTLGTMSTLNNLSSSISDSLSSSSGALGSTAGFTSFDFSTALSTTATESQGLFNLGGSNSVTTGVTKTMNALYEAWVQDTEGNKLAPDNARWIEEIVNKTDYTEEEIAKAKQIARTPHIKADFVNNDEPATSLKTSDADKLNYIIEAYDKAGGDNKSTKVIDKYWYNYIKNAMTQETLPLETLNMLRDIVENPGKYKKSSEEDDAET